MIKNLLKTTRCGDRFLMVNGEIAVIDAVKDKEGYLLGNVKGGISRWGDDGQDKSQMSQYNLVHKIPNEKTA